MPSVAVLVSLLLAVQAASQPAAPAALPQTPSSLVGVWEGIQRTDQAGDCMLAGSGTQRLQVAILVETDGSLRVERAGSARDLDWTGGIGDGRVVFEVPSQARCGTAGGGSSIGPRTVRYSGAFPMLKDGKRRLTLRGLEAPCPELGCRFDRTMILTWKAPLPDAGR
jgi:hypothetical protein